MMRNDYRRALILLRSNSQGYSGHVRLERRTLMGSMYFLLQTPPEAPGLRAVLAGRSREDYYACEIGSLQGGSRCQSMLTWNFDPRNICGRELEQYQLLLIVEEGGCEILLYGNVCGHADMNWDKVRMAVCELLGQTDAPEDAVQETQTPVVAAEEPQMEESDEKLSAPMEEETQPAQTGPAGNLLAEMGIDPDVPWPDSIDPVRTLFANGSIMENPPDDEYTYIAAPVPEESGYAYCAVGVRAENGVPVSVRYGIPMLWSEEPPAGLEEYTWVGDQNRGWWMIQTDVYPQSPV